MHMQAMLDKVCSICIAHELIDQENHLFDHLSRHWAWCWGILLGYCSKSGTPESPISIDLYLYLYLYHFLSGVFNKNRLGVQRRSSPTKYSFNNASGTSNKRGVVLIKIHNFFSCCHPFIFCLLILRFVFTCRPKRYAYI